MHSAPAVSRFFSGLLLAALFASARATGLPAGFVAALDQAGIPLDHVAVVVQALDEPEPILSHNAQAALNPASVMKLVTSFAALNQLGPDYAWTTDVWADGTIAGGVLSGDLVIKGHGDPTLSLERMWLLQQALRGRGVRHIHGNLLLDLSHFELPEIDTGAFDGEPFALYNAAPGALVANFNATPVRLTPEAGQLAIVPDIALPGVRLTSHVVLTEDAECEGWRKALTWTRPDPERLEWVVSGPYARSCGEQTWSLSLFEPAATFDFVFRELWLHSGGTLTGKTAAGHPPQTEPLLRFTSEPLAAALIRLNKYSSNLMARNLLLTLGAERYGTPATLDKGIRAVREVLIQRGVPTRKLVLENGAGLSRIERISADALTRMLRAAYSSPLFSEFESALPIVAVDGTLKQRFNGSLVRGNAHIKTGSLRDVRALAGYVYAASGKRISFVLLVNHTNADHSEMAQRALLEWVHAAPHGTQPWAGAASTHTGVLPAAEGAPR